MYQSDPSLIEACREGSERAWDELVDRYGRLVYSIPRRYGFSEEDCDDVFQRVFLILFRKLETLNDQKRLSAWLITTTRRECWRLRRQAPDHGQWSAGIDIAQESEDVETEVWEQQYLVREALRELGGRCERLLTALFLQSGEVSYEQIARDLGMKVGSIGPTRARCFEKLETILRKHGFAPAIEAIGRS